MVKTIMLSELFPSMIPEHLGQRFLQLFLETCFFTLIALLFAYMLGISQGGIIALFLVSASLMRRVRELLDENRDNIWKHKVGGWKANRISAISVLAIFSGLFVTCMVFAILLAKFASMKEVERFFDFILKTQKLHEGSIVSRFSSFFGILLNNCIVLFTTLLLGFIYRTYGMLLVICWNACIWSVVLLYVFRGAWFSSKMSGWVFLLRSCGAVLPHLILEATAYILAALAAIFLSRGYAKYEVSEKPFKQVFKASMTLLMLAYLTVVIAAVLESTLPRLLLTF